MAETPIPIPTPIEFPIRSQETDNAIYSGKSEAWGAGQPAQADATNDIAQTTYNNAVISEQKAIEAENAAAVSAGNANYAGLWSAQSGAASPPLAAGYPDVNPQSWILSTPIPDITASIPGPANSDWILASGVSIDDASPSLTKTYSSQRIEDRLAASGNSFEAAASGSISAGDVVVLNNDGTVGSVTVQLPTIGAPAVFESSNIGTALSVVNIASDKFVLFFRDSSGNGKSCVATVTGTTPSYGLTVTFNAATTDAISAVYDSVNGKVVVTYDNAGATFEARVGTVSGTNISFGAVETIASINVKFSLNRAIYDVLSGNILNVYVDLTNSEQITAAVGAVSGTTINYGSPVVLTTISINEMDATYDSSADKTVCIYSDGGEPSSTQTKSVVVTVSGTVPSFGAPSTGNNYLNAGIGYNDSVSKSLLLVSDADDSSKTKVIHVSVSGTTTSYSTPQDLSGTITGFFSVINSSVLYDSVNTRSIFFYRDSGNSSYYTFIAMDSDGSTVSLGTPTVVSTSSTSPQVAQFDSASGNILSAYDDTGNSNFGTSVVIETQESSNAASWTGISSAAYSDSEIATVQVIGSTDANQSALTIGSVYYVDFDGSIVDTVTVYGKIGKAIAADKLLIGSANI